MTTNQLTDFVDPETPEYNIDPRWVQEVRRGVEWAAANGAAVIASRTNECKQAKSASRRWLRTRSAHA